MAGNSFGTLFKLTTFGESHGAAIGGVIDGCPAGLEVDLQFIQHELDRRKPGQSELTTQRKETDTVEILSGLFEGKTTGTPIGFIIRNKDQQSADYDQLKELYRPGHADYTYDKKFGFRDHRGGGRSSARETACRVVAGAFAKLLLAHTYVTTHAYVSVIKDIELQLDPAQVDLHLIDSNSVRCPHEATATKMAELILKTKENGDSVGGIITCICKNVPAGWGEPVFDKLHAALGHAMLSINATKGFEIGDGFASTRLFGSEMNDEFASDTTTRSNHSGGIQGGISNGQHLVFRVAFKPTSTIAKSQQTIDRTGKAITFEATGRHDPCVLPRAVPIVEAMAALVLADYYLLSKNNKL